MKRLMLFLLVMLPCLLFAQSEDGKVELAEDKVGTFLTGIVAGGNGTRIDGDGFGSTIKGYDKLGGNVGLRTMVVVHKNWQPGLELLFTQKGSYKSAGKDGLGDQIKYILDYVEVPVIVSYLIERRVYAYTGFSYGRLIRSRVIINGEREDAIADQFKQNDFSFLVGGSIYLDQKKHWMADIRYQSSMADIYAGGIGFGGSTFIKQLNRVISVRMLYMF